MASARAALQTERAQGKVAEREWKYITDTSPTELSLRKPQLAQELARVKAAQASVLRAKRNLERTEIKAPYNAMIESRNIGLGSFVGAGTKIGKVLGTATAKIRLPVADNQLQFLINQGVDANVDLIGVFAGKEQTWSAKIARDEGVVDSKSRMSYLVAEIDDPYRLTQHSGSNEATAQLPLRFGSYVKAQVLGINIAQATTIPRYLVENNRVAILDSESKLHYADIDVIRSDGANVIVAGGLAHGDQLIVSALDYPIDGMKLALVSDKVEEDKTEETVDKKAQTQVASIGED